MYFDSQVEELPIRLIEGICVLFFARRFGSEIGRIVSHFLDEGMHFFPKVGKVAQINNFSQGISFCVFCLHFCGFLHIIRR